MLADKQCKNAVCPPDKKRVRFTDSAGLYLEVSRGGSKRWFWKLYTEGKESRLALGSYPAVGLAEARRARDAARLQKHEGLNPVQVRKSERLKAGNPAGTAFRDVALEWHGKQHHLALAPSMSGSVWLGSFEVPSWDQCICCTATLTKQGGILALLLAVIGSRKTMSTQVITSTTWRRGKGCRQTFRRTHPVDDGRA